MNEVTTPAISGGSPHVVSCDASDCAANEVPGSISGGSSRDTNQKGRTAARLWFLGFGLYWTWVYLSFNSAAVVQFSHADDAAITWLHVWSGLAGCLTFFMAIYKHRQLEQSAKALTILWTSAAIASFGSMFYATAVINNATVSLILGAVLPGLTTPLLALGWGVLFCTLDARWAAGLTAGSFFLSGVLYWAISMLPEPLSGVVVAFLPLASVFMMTMCPTHTAHPFTLHRAPAHGDSEGRNRVMQELKNLVQGPFSSRALVGIFLTMVVSGGLRTFVAMQAPAVYHEPGIVGLSNCVVALAFLVYSAFLPHTSLRLGPLYRLAAPLFALGIAAVTVFTTPSSSVSYFAASAGSELIDMLTWVLLIEIARSSRFSALLIFAVGRFVIHLGMALGEIVALAVPGSMVAFGVVSIVALMVIAGFMFSDHDEALVFEPVAEGEIDFADVEETKRASVESDDGEALSAAVDARIAALANAYGLTAREAEVFTLWATGHGAKSIEEKLVLSSATVRTHVRHIYEKCDVHSRAELIDLIERAK